MPVQIRQDHRSPQFPQPVHGLDHHLAKPLTGSHNVCRIDRLICTDQHKFLAPALQRRACCLICPQNVILYSFTRACLHQWHMLMCRRMIDHIRSVFCEHTIDPPAVPHRSDQNDQVQFWILSPQLLFYVISIVLIDIKDDQPLRSMRRNLPAQLAPNGTSAAGNKDRLVLQRMEDLLHIDLDGIPSQQVLHSHVLHLTDRHFPVHQLVDPREYLQFTPCLLADI